MAFRKEMFDIAIHDDPCDIEMNSLQLGTYKANFMNLFKESIKPMRMSIKSSSKENLDEKLTRELEQELHTKSLKQVDDKINIQKLTQFKTFLHCRESM